MNTRQPIVTVLGHVDHGKTSLLDCIRKSNVVSREAGGITQRIGAYEASTPHGLITFIDTPGHAAFSAMRARGASAADIAILAVAANEGVKPQTREALGQIRQAGIPLIVAATKIDLPSSDIEIVRGQLEKEGVLFEGRGGDTPLIPVSAKTGEGIEHLLEMITLMAQVHEIGKDAKDQLKAIVIESMHDPRKGPLATVVVHSGKVKVGDQIYAQNSRAKVRAMVDAFGKTVQELVPGKAAQTLGFLEVPAVGSLVTSQPSTVAQVQKQAVEKIEKDRLQLVVKADTAGTLEAILSSLDPRAAVISSGIGEVNQNDVMLASSFHASVLGFGVRIPAEISKLAEEEGVLVKPFAIIYKALQWVTEIVEGKEKPQAETILGKAEIITEFLYGKSGRIAGVRVREGRIAKSDVLRITRKDTVIAESRIESLKKQVQNIDVVPKGEECGIVFSRKFDFQVGDMVLSVK